MFEQDFQWRTKWREFCLQIHEIPGKLSKYELNGDKNFSFLFPQLAICARFIPKSSSQFIIPTCRCTQPSWRRLLDLIIVVLNNLKGKYQFLLDFQLFPFLHAHNFTRKIKQCAAYNFMFRKSQSFHIQNRKSCEIIKKKSALHSFSRTTTKNWIFQ